MTRFLRASLTLVFVALSTAPVLAQTDSEPLVEVELNETEVIPGQSVVLRVTVLVPTWMPKPVVFPSLETPDLMVKLMERATSPTSRTVDGETWSGVSRAYRLSPMVPGTIAVPAQELVVYWAEPVETDPKTSRIKMDPFAIVGILPEGAEDLHPFVAATSLTLSQELSSEETTLKPGDSLTRTVTAQISGTSPLFLPTLLPPHQIQGVASYPVEPVVTEKADRTWLSGERVESTTLVAESGGSGAVPAVELRWYNLESGEIETASIDGFEVTVDGPVARNLPKVDARIVALIAVLAGLALYAAIRGFRYLSPRIAGYLARRRAAHVASEAWAYDRLRSSVADKNYPAFAADFEVWWHRLPGPSSHLDPPLRAAIAELGACIYGKGHNDANKAWADVSKALKTTRTERLNLSLRNRDLAALYPLNPT
ncbi:MAG: hypothetical protein AAF667_02335 [Pseudomonadota bacterium]